MATVDFSVLNTKEDTEEQETPKVVDFSQLQPSPNTEEPVVKNKVDYSQLPQPEMVAPQEEPIPEEVEDPSYSLPEHLLEVVPQIGKGIVDGGESTVDAVQDLGSVLNPNYKINTTLAGVMLKALMNEAVGDTPLTRNIENGNIGFSEAKTLTGTVLNDLSQFLTGLFGGAKLIKGVGYVAKTAKAKIGVSAVASGASESVAFETAEQGFTEMLNQYPMFEPFMPDFMERSEGASNGEIRLKKFIDGLGWGILGDSLFLGLKALKAKKHGDIDEAVKLAEEAENNVTAKAAGEEPTVKAEGEPEVKVDGEPTVKAEGETPDANKVLPDEPVEIKNVTVFGEKKIAQLRAAIQEAQSSEEVDVILEGLDFNFENMTGDDSAKDVINAISEIIAPQIDKIKGGVQTFGEIEDLANVLGQDVNILVQNMRTTYGATANLAATATAGRMLLQKMGGEVSRLTSIVSDPKVATTVHKAELIQKMKMMTELLALQKGVQTNTARALASHRIKAGDAFTELSAKDLDSIIATAGGDKELVKLAKNLQTSRGDIRKMAKQMEKSFAGKILDVHNEYWINSILSGPVTHAVNITSALAQSFILPANRLIGATMQGDRVAIRESTDHFLGMYQSIWESFVVAGAAMKKGDNVLDTAINTGSRVELTNHAVSSKNFNVRQNTLGGRLIDGVGAVVRAPSRFLLSEDEFFKQMTYRARVRSKAWADARTQGLSSKEKGKFVEKRLAESFDESGRAIDEDSLQWAREVTFTQDLGEGIGKDWQDFVTRHPALRIVTPFIRTPTNILRSVAQHTPGIQLIQKQMREDLASTGSRRQMALGKIATGNALYILAGGLAMSGHITGGKPRDNASLAEAKYATGWLPYSFVFENEDGTAEYVPFGRLDPFGMVFGIMGDGFSMHDDLTDETWDEIAVVAMSSVFKNITSKTYLSGLTNMLDTINSGSPYKLRRFLNSQAGSYVPNLFNQLNNDPIYRESRTLIDAIFKRIPVLSETLPPKRTVLGEVIPKNTHALPWQTSVERDEPVYEELRDLDGPLAHPPEEYNNIDLTKFKNSKGQDAYDRYTELQGTIKINRKTLKERLLKEIETFDAKGLPKDVGHYKSKRSAIIQSIAMKYRDKAISVVQKDDTFKDKESGVSLGDALMKERKASKIVEKGGLEALKQLNALINQ